MSETFDSNSLNLDQSIFQVDIYFGRGVFQRVVNADSPEEAITKVAELARAEGLSVLQREKIETWELRRIGNGESSG